MRFTKFNGAKLTFFPHFIRRTHTKWCSIWRHAWCEWS